ncbi:hypothetical protein [Halobaculum sp. MBLA0143]|uniref:hypothetical protein n=1 Tax=Halobaculum sp. MBLA0143 TaxID=3079933 RepID=UPI003525D440
MARTTVVADTARRLLAPRRSVLLAFGLLVGLSTVYYLQLLVGEPLPGVDATLRVVNRPVELLARTVGYGAVPDPLGLVVFLGYYYLLAVGLAWVGRRLSGLV